MKLAIFDFDGTLLDGQTMMYFLKYYISHKGPKLIFIKTMLRLLKLAIDYKLGSKYDQQAFRHQAVRISLSLIEGKSKEETDAYFNKLYNIMENDLNQAVFHELQELKSQGYKIIILSGCFEMLLKKFNKSFQADHIIGTQLTFENNYLSIDKHTEIITGKNKVKAIEAKLDMSQYDLKNSIAYGDSALDRYIFQLVGSKVAVKPDDKLHKYAQENNYRIMT